MGCRLTLTDLEDRWTPAAGDLDLAFGSDGRFIYPFAATSSPSGGAVAVIPGADGSALLVGNDSNLIPTAVRVRADGTVDPSFGRNGLAQLPVEGSSNFVNAVTVLPDGTVALVGSTFNGTVRGVSYFLSPDGHTVSSSPVSSPGPDTQDVFSAVAAQPDGRVVVAGLRASTTGDSTLLVGRLIAGGGLDPTFGAGGFTTMAVGSSVSVGGVSVRPDGRILVAGTTASGTAGTGSVDVVLAQFTADGRPDTAFAPGGVRTFDLGGSESIRALVLLADGRALLGGDVTAGPTTTGVVARVQADGTPDPTFGDGGTARLGFASPNGTAGGLAVQPNGRLVVAGSGGDAGGNVTFGRFAVARLGADGRPDPTFGTNGVRVVEFGTEARARAVAVQPDGGLLAAGGYGGVGGGSVGGYALARLYGDLPPVPAGSVAVGGTPDGSARVLAATVSGLASTVPVTLYPNFTGTVRTATADVNGDGVPDLIAGPGPGGGPNVVILDGATGQKLADFNAFETTFSGGVFVAAADLNGDGKAEVVVTPDQGGGPVVAIYDGAVLAAGQNAGASLARFYGIEDVNFRGGARAALGDVNADGTPDLVVAAGFGGGPRVAVYDGRVVLRPGLIIPQRLTPDFYVFEPTLRDGVYVTVADLTGDGAAEVVAGGGPGGGPRVFALNGRDLTAFKLTPVADFFAGDPASRGGVRLATQGGDLITGSGAGQPAQVRVYTPAAARTGTPSQTLTPFGGASLADGVYVG